MKCFLEPGSVSGNQFPLGQYSVSLNDWLTLPRAPSCPVPDKRQDLRGGDTHKPAQSCLINLWHLKPVANTLPFN